MNVETTTRTDLKQTGNNAEEIEAIRNDGSSGTIDKAGQWLKEAGHSVVVTPSENKRILRKIDLAILPILLVVYCLQFLDKGQSFVENSILQAKRASQRIPNHLLIICYRVDKPLYHMLQFLD